MFFIIFKNQNISGYITAIIGVLGTLLGTTLGWVLHLISENRERLYITVDDFLEQKSDSNEYGYIFKIFIYNESYKQQCIRDIKVLFVNAKNKILIESVPSEGRCTFETIRTQKEKKTTDNVISVNSYNGIKVIYSDILDKTDYEKMLYVKKIYLYYKNRKNHIKKKLIKSDFKLSSIESCETKSFL